MTDTASGPTAVLCGDLRQIFGDRFHSLVLYGMGIGGNQTTHVSAAGEAIHTLALVDSIGIDDLTACAQRSQGWRNSGLAIPLVLSRTEFERSLDAFPLEYGGILASHVVIAGPDPFTSIAVRPEDLRRACEIQAKSHLIHLREGYIEAGGDPRSIAALMAASAGSLAAILTNVAQLQGASAIGPTALAREAARISGIDAATAERILSITKPDQISTAEAPTLYRNYLAVAERLWRYIDEWTCPPGHQ